MSSIRYLLLQSRLAEARQMVNPGILDVEVNEQHRRSPIFTGSENMVLPAEQFMSQAGKHLFRIAIAEQIV
jgi:fructose-1,6-bisphosphatase